MGTSPLVRAKIWEMWIKGKQVREIAAALNHSPTQVASIINFLEVTKNKVD